MVCFSVQDRGIGIPAEQRSRVFQPFVRLEQTQAPGSGIGLAIVQRIVELYGGRVWIEGAEHEGCTMKFTIPWLEPNINPADGMTSEGDIPKVINMPANDLI